MGLDIQLRIAQAIGNLTFTSTESQQVFILFAHLPGFEKDEIEVSVNEVGTEISVAGGGEREAQEVTISRRVAITHEASIGRFRKVFCIPSNVVLERIEAVFDEDKEILIIMMPKLIRGEPSGVETEELQISKPEREENGDPEEVDLPEKMEEEIEKLPSPESTEREVEVEKIDKTTPPELTEREVEVKLPEKTEKETEKQGHPEEPLVGPLVLEASIEEDREAEIPARPPEFPKPTEIVEFEQPKEETEPENGISSPKPEIEERETMPEGDSETREPAGSPKPDENAQPIDKKIEENEDRYPERTVEPPDRDGHQSNREDKENEEDGTIEPFETPDQDVAETQDRAPGTPQSTREPDEDLYLHQVEQQEQPEEEEELNQTEEQEQPELETSAAIEQTEEKTEGLQGPEVSRSPEQNPDLCQPEEREIPAAEPERDPLPKIDIPNDLESIEPSKPDLDLQQPEEQKHETTVESPEEEQIPPESLKEELESLEGINGGELNGEEEEGAEALSEERDSEVEDGIEELGGEGGGSGETGRRRGRTIASLPIRPSSILTSSAFIIALVVLVLHLLKKKRRER